MKRRKKIVLTQGYPLLAQIAELDLPKDAAIYGWFENSGNGIEPDEMCIFLSSDSWPEINEGVETPMLIKGQLSNGQPIVTKTRIVGSVHNTQELPRAAAPVYPKDNVHHVGGDLSKSATCICDLAHTGLRAHKAGCPQK